VFSAGSRARTAGTGTGTRGALVLRHRAVDRGHHLVALAQDRFRLVGGENAVDLLNGGPEVGELSGVDLVDDRLAR
jgi:hypothetical protein